jgi:Uma2 family endonuclease
MAVEQRLVTADELERMPGDGLRRELIRGVVRTMAPGGGPHGRAGGPIHGHLSRFVYDNPVAEILMAETGFLLGRDPDTVRAPDVAVVRVERIPPEGLPRGYVPFPPDLAVEVVSPNDTASEVEEKVDEWLRFGARLVWVAYPTGPRLSVHRADGTTLRLGPDDDVDGGDVLPGFRMKVRDLFYPFKR